MEHFFSRARVYQTRQNRICGSKLPKRLPGGFIAVALPEQLNGLSKNVFIIYTYETAQKQLETLISTPTWPHDKSCELHQCHQLLIQMESRFHDITHLKGISHARSIGKHSKSRNEENSNPPSKKPSSRTEVLKYSITSTRLDNL